LGLFGNIFGLAIRAFWEYFEALTRFLRIFLMSSLEAFSGACAPTKS
jgi:hypothetical protein